MNRLYIGVALALVTIAGCGSSAENNKAVSETVCTETTVSAPCILKTADRTLGDIEDEAAWAASAAELAVAYGTSGEPQRAIALLTEAADRASALEDGKERNAALSDIAIATYSLNRNDDALPVLNKIAAALPSISDEDKRWDIAGKHHYGEAVHADPEQALAKTLQMPEASPSQEGVKAIALRKLAALSAKNGDFDGAEKIVSNLTMSISYYRSMVRSDIAVEALKHEDKATFTKKLDEAATIARDQDNGYFIGAALRDIAQAYARAGDMEKADQYFSEARGATREAKTFQEQARSMSRIATRMGDVDHTGDARSVIEEATALARQEENEIMRQFSFYEIAGAAAMSGNPDLSRDLIAEIPDTPFSSAHSLKAASERDLAWGLTRAGKAEEGLKTALAIKTERERVHALARMIRLLNNPKMQALPRYL